MAAHIVFGLLILIGTISGLVLLTKVVLRLARIKNKTELSIYSQISLGDGTNDEDEEELEEEEFKMENEREELDDQEDRLEPAIESASILIEPGQNAAKKQNEKEGLKNKDKEEEKETKGEKEEKETKGEKEEKETKGEKEEDNDMKSTAKDGMALTMEVTEQTYQQYLEQLGRQVDRNRNNPRVERQLQKYLHSPYLFFLHNVLQNYVPLFRLIYRRQSSCLFPRLRLSEKGHLAVFLVGLFVQLACLLYINAYFHALDLPASTGWVVVAVLATYVGTLRHNYFMIKNTVLPLFFHYDNYHLTQNKAGLGVDFEFDDQDNQPQLQAEEQKEQEMISQVIDLDEGESEESNKKIMPKQDYYMTKGAELRKSKSAFQKEKEFIELWISRTTKKTLLEDKLGDTNQNTSNRQLLDGQLISVFICAILTVFLMYVIGNSLSTTTFVSLLTTLIPVIIVEQIVLRPVFALLFSFWQYRLFTKSYNLHLLQLREDFLRKNMAYQGVMAKKQRVVEEVERRLEEQRRREKEELKRLLKQYNKNQIQDIDDQALLRDRMDYDRAGLYGSDYDEDDDYSDEELSPWAQKYGKSVSPSRPMFDPYQSDVLSKPFFNDEQTKQISSLLDHYNNSLTNSLSKTMDLNMGSFMMMNRYNPQFKKKQRLPALPQDIVNKNLFEKIKVMTQRINNIDDFEKNELQREFIGVMNRKKRPTPQDKTITLQPAK